MGRLLRRAAQVVGALWFAFVPLQGRTEESRELFFATLRVRAEALARNPADRSSAEAVARMLRELGGFYGAGEADRPASLGTRAGQAAERVRWGANIPPVKRSQRFAGTDEALAMLDGLIKEALAGGNHDILVQLRGDRVVALRDRERWRDALGQLDELRSDGAPIRPYLREAEADSLLALRKPEEARVIYAELVGADPGNHNARVGRFYAEIECEDFRAALKTADELDDPVLAAQARYYADLNSQAWGRIAPLVRRAPALAYLRTAAANIEAARGWPRLAHEDASIASHLDPEDVGVAVALGESLLRRRDVAAARELAATLAADAPADASVLRLRRELRDFDSAVWEAEVRARHESGGAPSAPGPGIEATGRVYSAPFDDAFRLFAGVGHATAQPPEGVANRSRAGAGMDWRAADTSVEIAGWANWGDVSRPGASASASWSPTDFWTFAADYERYAWDTPLRAVLHGITSNGGGIGVSLAWNESREALVGYRMYQFTDGNERRQYRIAWAERVVEEPSWTVTLRPGLYGSHNSLAGAPYYNPPSDLELSLAADVQNRLWRRYEESFRQGIIATVGRYREEGYPDGWVGDVTYEQVWERDSRLELHWGIDVGRARYDGANEQVAILFVSGTGRF